MTKPRHRSQKVHIDGLRFDSLNEAARYLDLKALQAQGVISQLDADKKNFRFLVTVEGKPLCTVTPDFCYVNSAGVKIYEDTKSAWTARDPYFQLRRRCASLLLGIEIEVYVNKPTKDRLAEVRSLLRDTPQPETPPKRRRIKAEDALPLTRPKTVKRRLRKD